MKYEFMVLDESTLKRFWSKVDKSGGPDGCWPWTASIGRDGYGKFYFSKKLVGRIRGISSHRMSLGLFTDTFPESTLYCLHSCEMRACCNPAHLRWGTHDENMEDFKDNPVKYKPMFEIHIQRLVVRKRRNAGLSPENLEEIRRFIKKGLPQTQIAKLFNISQTTVSLINRRKTKFYSEN